MFDVLARKASLLAIIFSKIFPKQFNREMTLYNFDKKASLLGFFNITFVASF